jgi:hypothetical protein
MSDEYVFEFDKFMQDIAPAPGPVGTMPVNQEAHEELTPQREYIRRYRELPQNKTTWRR